MVGNRGVAEGVVRCGVQSAAVVKKGEGVAGRGAKVESGGSRGGWEVGAKRRRAEEKRDALRVR